jgi:hypothetical protein
MDKQLALSFLGLTFGAMVLWSCSPPAKSACAGLVYKEYGLSRQEFAPCAKAMIATLDRIYADVAIMGNAARPKAERLRARSDCIADASELAHLIGDAGGTQKLVSMPWDDEELSRFNTDVGSARTAYVMYCYYGLTGETVTRLDPNHEAARAIAAQLP